jgi:hypothetical protein
MDTLIIALLLLIIGILVYMSLQNDPPLDPPIPSINQIIQPTASINTSINTSQNMIIQPVEALASGYPLQEEYYYDPAIYYDPLWWYYFGNYGSNSDNYKLRLRNRYPTSSDVVHGLNMGGGYY